MKTFQDFSPYNALHWVSNDSRSKWEFQRNLPTVQRALNDSRRWIRVLSSETIAHLKNKYQTLSFISTNGRLALLCDVTLLFELIRSNFRSKNCSFSKHC